MSAVTMFIAGMLFVAGQILRGTTALFNKPDDYSPQIKRAGGQLSNTRNAQEPVRLIYGRTRVGVNIVYMNSSGDNNNQLDIIGIIGEGPIQGIAKGEIGSITIDGSNNILEFSYNGGTPQFLTIPIGLYPDLQHLSEVIAYNIGTSLSCDCTGKWNSNSTFTFSVPVPNYITYHHSGSTLGTTLGFTKDQTGQVIITDYSVATGADQLFLDGKIYTNYGESVKSYTIYTGTPDQVAATVSGEWNDPLRNTAYIHLVLLWDSSATNQWQGMPAITVEVNGLKVYNPITEVFAYSDNPALAARDFMTRSSRRGGMGYAESRIDDDAISTTAAYCDYKGWKLGYPTVESNEATQILSDILATFRGELIYSDSLFKLRYRDLNFESAVLSLDEADILENAGKSTLSVLQPSIYNTPNAVRMKFLNSRNNYIEDDYVLADPAAIESDGGDYRETTVTITGIFSYFDAMRMANYWLERLRINKSITFVGGSKCLQLEPFDLVTFSYAKLGWVDKYLRVEEIKYNQDGTASIQFSEEYLAFYDDTYNLTDHDWHDTTLPDPNTDTVPSVINVSTSEETYTVRERTFTRWKVNFSPPASATYPWWDYAEIWVKITEAGDWKFMTKSSGDYQLDPVEEGTTYYCKMVSVSIFGTKEDFDTAYTVSKNITGSTGAVPGSLASLTAIAAGDTVNIFAADLDEADISGYETRIGDSWASGILFSFTKSAKVRLTDVKPGTLTFWMAAKNNAGYYSTTPRSATVIVYYPSGYADIGVPWSWDFKTGIHKNTEYYLSGAIDTLKCSHSYVSGDNLITNGDFDDDVTGWTEYNSPTAAAYDATGYTGGALKITCGATPYAGMYQDVTAIVVPSASISPSKSPSPSPSLSPSLSPSGSPSLSPSRSPSESPSLSPSASPSESPSESPSVSPSASLSPSASPSKSPSASPSASPSTRPSLITTAFSNELYDVFTGASASGFHAEKTNTNPPARNAYSADEIVIVAGKKYLLEFTGTLTSGTKPGVYLSTVKGSSNISGFTSPTFITGAVHYEFIAGQSATCCLFFQNGMDDLVSYTVANLTLTEVYESVSPSASPSLSPSASPSKSPSASPSKSPSKSPSMSPSPSPSKSPSLSPSMSISPSKSPSASPSLSPSASLSPSESPSVEESGSESPSASPSLSPSTSPSESPSLSPSASPSVSPSASPSFSPSKSPSGSPSLSPSASPSTPEEDREDYILQFRYKNTAGDVAAYGVYDVTHSADLIATTDLADSTSWSDVQSINIVAPKGCDSIRIYLLGKSNTDIVWFDDVALYVKATAPNLTGTWISPVYDFTAPITVRVWGDFLTEFTSSGLTWNGIIPAPMTWNDLDITRTWSQIFASNEPAQLSAKIKWGTTTACDDGEADYFQVTAPEFTARYVQVEVTITDPTADTALLLKELTCTKAYWS